MSPDKILILRFSSLGDILMTTAMVRAVRQRFPLARIDMVVREDFLDLIRHNPHLTHAIGLPRGGGFAALKRLLETLNSTRYDLIYDAHRSLRTRYLLPRLNAPIKVAYDKHYLRRTAALLFKFPKLTDRTRMLERFCLPLSPFGVRYDGGGPELVVPVDEVHAAESRLPKLPAGASRVGLIPSAQWPGKRWPWERYREVALRILEHSLHQILIFGGKEDTFCGPLSAGLPPERVVNLQGGLSLAGSLAALSLCRWTVANDTGLMHAADALGIPTTLILGPTSGELGCLPFHGRSRVLEHDLWCRPCSKNGQAPCVRGRRVCLDRTRAEDVFAALEGLWHGEATP